MPTLFEKLGLANSDLTGHIRENLRVALYDNYGLVSNRECSWVNGLYIGVDIDVRRGRYGVGSVNRIYVTLGRHGNDNKIRTWMKPTTKNPDFDYDHLAAKLAELYYLVLNGIRISQMNRFESIYEKHVQSQLQERFKLSDYSDHLKIISATQARFDVYCTHDQAIALAEYAKTLGVKIS